MVLRGKLIITNQQEIMARGVGLAVSRVLAMLDHVACEHGNLIRFCRFYALAAVRLRILNNQLDAGPDGAKQSWG